METNVPLYNCLVVDDEPLAREIIKRHIEKMPMLRLAGECSNALQAITFLHRHPVDLIFLDIQMPQLDGFALVKTLAHPPKIIFITAFAEYALQSYEVAAVDYLLKPVKIERFIKAVNKALPLAVPEPDRMTLLSKEAVIPNDTFLYFRAERKMVKVLLHEIVYIESLKDYVRIVMENGQLITRYSMAALEAMLPVTEFARIHRSYIIAISKLNSYTSTHVQVRSKELPIGKLYLREVTKILRTGKDLS